MRVEELVIDGFKSYAVRTVVSGWDPQFNAITGLNGSGKSNILDAICFVLGINNTSNLRAGTLQDLIYKRGQAGVTKASVTITFDNSDKEHGPIGFERYPKISVTRQVVLGGGSKYLINGHKAPQIQVLNLFQSVQLNINHPNFLIMQGKIIRMLDMKPTEILGLIEEAAGTKMYEWQREKAEKTMGKKNVKLTTTEALLNEEIEPKLSQLREKRRIVMEYEQLLQEYELLSKAVAAYDYLKHTKLVETLQSKVDEVSGSAAESANLVAELEQEIARLQERLLAGTNDANANASAADSAALKAAEAAESQASSELARLEESKKIQLAGAEKKRELLSKARKELQVSLQKAERQTEERRSLDEDYTRVKQALEQQKEALSRKEDLLSTLSTGISSKGGTDGGYMSHLEDAKKKISDSQVDIEKDKLQIGHLRTELQANQRKVKDKEADLTKIQDEINKRKRQAEALQVKMRDLGYNPQRYDELKTTERQLLLQFDRCSRDFQMFRRNNSRFDFSYEPPSANFNPNSVKGLAGELFSVEKENIPASTALETCGGGRLFNVVVDNEVTGSQLLEHGKLRRRVTLIPLNKISARVIDNRKLNAAKQLGGDNVDLALHLIQYEPESKKAMEYIFGNRLICKDPETAKKVTFNPQVHTGSVTYDGDSYDPEGRLSGGSRRKTSSTIEQFNRFRTLKKQCEEVQARLNATRQELQQLSRARSEAAPLQQQYQTEQYHIETLEKKLSGGNSASFLRHNQELSDQISVLEKKINDSNENIERYKAEVNDIEQDMKEFNSDGAKKLRGLRSEIQQMTRELETSKTNTAKKQQEFQDYEVASEQLQGDINTLKEEIAQMEEQTSSIDLSDIEDKISASEAKLEESRTTIERYKRETAERKKEIQHMTSLLADRRKEHQVQEKKAKREAHQKEELTQKLESSKQFVANLLEEFDWLEDENVFQDVIDKNSDMDLEMSRRQIQKDRDSIATLKKKGVDSNIKSQIDQHEKHEKSLKSKINQIKKDKEKIEDTIKKLDSYKRTELDKTYQKVSTDFGQIFGDLLPQAFAKLTPVDVNDITKGLEVKVKLGNVWKQSLVELSGGQRSLVALSLIMALLQFKPAPLYILDEVDAALDLSHTQSIGQLIKTRFKGAQFIVVSLKEGMFTNANRLFKVRFQEGTSVVTAT